MYRLPSMLLALAAVIAPATTMAQTSSTRLNPPPGPWTLPGAPVVFPERIGDYQRALINESSPRNHSVGYILQRDGKRLATITIYVYALDANPTCQQVFTDSAALIMRSTPTALRLTTGTAASPRGGKPDAALTSRFSYSTSFGGVPDRLVHSDLYLYCRPGSAWKIGARTSWPADTDMSGETARVLRAITWAPEMAD
ncbi:MAG: hypothetical protein V4808_16510 [Pseudomonadota bacterium]